SLDIGEMSYAERNQGQAVERPRDAQTLVSGGETETLPVTIAGEPDVQNPGGRYHHRGLQAAQLSCIPGSRKRWGTSNSTSQARRKLSRTREATAAVRCQNRPMPATREMKAQR